MNAALLHAEPHAPSLLSVSRLNVGVGPVRGLSDVGLTVAPGELVALAGEANPEAARRAGINVARIRTLGFVMCSVTAGLAGLAYESRQGSISTDIDGGNLVLFGVAAAVIGGTSLFGGKGRMLHALLGGIVIAAVFDGLALMNVSAAVQDMATAVVLIAAVTLDSLVRRRATAR
jgi:D-xylose transport system permease protein